MERTNTGIIGFPKKEKRKNRIESIFEKILANNLLKWLKYTKSGRIYQINIYQNTLINLILIKYINSRSSMNLKQAKHKKNTLFTLEKS